MTETNFDDIEPYDIKNAKKVKDLAIKKKEIQEYFTNPQCMKFLTKSLPRVGITADRMTRIIFSAISKIPTLAECSPQSLFSTMIQCAQIGLEPNTALGHAYILPFWDGKSKTTRANLIIGYKGMIALCRRSTEFSHIAAYPVYPGDQFDVKLGTEEYIKHTPDYSQDHDPKDMLFTYAVAKFKDGSYIFEVMTKFDIDKIRARSKSPNKGPWVTDYIQMARKTVIRRLMNYLPLSSEMAEAVKIDGENEVGIDSMSEMFASAIEIDQESEEKKTERKRKRKTKQEKEEKVNNEKPIKESDFTLALRSLDMRNITHSEIMAYFNIEDISELDCEEGIKDLQRIATDIEGEKISVEEFKNTAKERYEMKQKENNKKTLL